MRFRAFRAALIAVVTCAGVVAVGQTPALAAVPKVSVMPATGQPGSTVTVRGAGFTAGEPVDVYFDTTDEALTVASSLGDLPPGLTVSVPASAVPGIHYISAVGRHSGLAGQAEFLVSTDWPQYRDGSRHRGYNGTENVLSPSNVSSIDMAWSFATGNNIDSSPAVANLLTFSHGNPVPRELVYVGSTDDNVYAINASTGTLAWKFTTGGEVESSPAEVGGVVYVGSDDGNVYALNASTGAKIWSFTIGSPVTSPAVVGGVVYAASENGDVHALSAASGTELWNFITGVSIGSSPSVANGRVYIGTAEGNVYALNAATGAQVWSTLTESEASATSPAVAGGVVYFGSSDGNVYAFNAFTGAQLWSSPIGGTVLESSPAVANGVLYIGSTDGNVYAYNAATGAELWAFTTGNTVRSSPTVANGVLYAASLDDDLYAFDLAGGTAGVRRPAPSRLRPNYALRPQHARGTS